MKADRLSRKTHLKRHAALPAGEGVKVFDLTKGEDEGAMLPGPRPSETPLIDLTADAPVIRPLAVPQSGRDLETISALPARFATEDDLYDWCLAVLAESPTAKRLLEDAAARGWAIGTADLHSGGFYLDTAQRHILLDHFSMRPALLGRSVYFRNAFVTTLIRALRDIWHEHRINPYQSEYKPEHVLMLERVRAADCDTVTIQAGWELRGAGFADVWRHILGSEE